MSKILCIYHAPCADGFGAAWSVRHALGDHVEFHPGVYGQEPPDVRGRHVLLVDFSYKRDVLLEMGKRAKTIIILDHHKSAAEDLAGFKEPAPYEEWQDTSLNLVVEDMPPIAALFDMNRSGAGMTWDYFNPGKDRPALINHIEDRDLWRFNLSSTREIQAAVFSYPYDFTVWDGLMTADPISLFNEGVGINRKQAKDIDELLGVAKRRMMIAGHDVPVCNLPYTLSSEAGNIMGKDEPFAACYMDTADARMFSLRSAQDGIDVSEVAKQFGGGGHAHASGFQVPRSHELARS